MAQKLIAAKNARVSSNLHCPCRVRVLCAVCCVLHKERIKFEKMFSDFQMLNVIFLLHQSQRVIADALFIVRR